MFRSTKLLLALLLAAGAAQAQQQFPHIGRPATPKEVAAWDIDVRPDFKGLPKGSGTVAKGMQVWEGRCASCHGTFGESNEVFTPIIGGTTADDIKTGHVAALKTNRQPQRTTIMKVATVSTLWDYIHRAMPWTAPKSLSTDEVYAVVAYILNMAEIVPDDFTLSDQNIAEVQKRMPNRNGMTTAHGLWDVKGKPDVKSVACMKNCAPTELHSTLPEVSRNAHGNLAQQNRTFGPVRGVDTTGKPAAAAAAAIAPARSPALAIAEQNACLACHDMKNKLVGPGFAQVAERYKGDVKAPAALAAKIRTGGSGNWGQVPMPPQSQLKDLEVQQLVAWILGGAN
ncbi:c-type cytochrome [Massilia solisilvae]|uniref:C-type cytochrome n=1 Tax=Massilia solisilvae TaxID=1811225 RepID=A0ABT2BID3_9BURK|nr:c-type cytochrome [Massilia solisilvae]MCS0607653.1 c-type cytochrome [Massilia solisilvae]